jgi:hypothetical protein
VVHAQGGSLRDLASRQEIAVSLVAWAERSALATLMHDQLWIYPTMLTLHAIGLAFAAGVSAAIDLRVLGAAAALPLAAMRRTLPIVYIALAVNAVSGVALVFNDPGRTLVDPVFYVKLTLLACALATLQAMKQPVFDAGDAPRAATLGKLLASASLAFWLGAIVTGRLLAYGFFR